MMNDYHWRDGWHFRRTEDGSVEISHKQNVQAVIPPEEWASIVGSVSSGGDTNENFRAIRAIHG